MFSLREQQHHKVESAPRAEFKKKEKEMSYDEDGPTKCIAFLENVIDIFGYQVECCRENEGWSAYCVKHIKYDDVPENTSCSICMENVSKYKPFTLTNCKHYFHRECFHKLKRFSDACPMCRADLDSPPLPGKSSS